MTIYIGRLFDEFADSLLEAWLNRTTSPLPSNYKVGLLMELPTGGDGAGMVEVAVGEYSRQTIAASSSAWDSLGVGSRAMSNLTTLTFPSAFTYWGVLKGYLLVDAADETRLVGYGAVPETSMLANNRVRFGPGTLNIALPW